jgi:hypothetical protein
MMTTIISPLALLVVGVTLNHDWPAPRDVDTAARYYRIQVYETFRTDRPEYDARIEQGRELLNKSRRAKSDAEKAEVIAWFESARTASAPGQIDPLPELPAAEWLVNAPAGEDTDAPRQEVTAEWDTDRDFANQPNSQTEWELSSHAGDRKAMGRGPNSQTTATDREHQGTVPHLVSRVGRALIKSVAGGSEGPKVVEQTTQWNVDAADAADAKWDQLAASENIEELNARLAGQNLAVEAVVRRLQSEWSDDLSQIESLVEKLEKLAESQRELQLVVQAVPAEAGKQLIALDTIDNAVQQISERLEQLQANLTGENEGEQPSEKLTQIDELQSRVKDLAR